MSIACLMAFVLIVNGAVGDAYSRQLVEIRPEKIKQGENGIEIVTVHVKIKPGFFVYGNPQTNEFLQGAELKLVIKSKEPKTKFEVKYPKTIEVRNRSDVWTKFEGDITIAAFVHRAKSRRRFA
jgi:hypothetical protein